MDSIEHFLISLAKEGLVRARIECQGREYAFSKERGVAKVDVKQPSTAPRATDRRVPVLETDDRSIYLSESPGKGRGGRSLKYVGFVLVFVVAALAVFLGLPQLKKGTVGPEENMWRTAQETRELASYQAYLETYPEGRYASEAQQRIEALRGAGDSGSPYSRHLKEAGDFLEQGELFKAWNALKQAGAIQTDDGVIQLERRIFEKIAALGDDERHGLYMEMAQGALKDEDVAAAERYLGLANGVRTTANGETLARQIEDLRKQKEIRAEYERLVKEIEKALDSGNLEQAATLLDRAKAIDEEGRTPELEQRLARAEQEKKTFADEAKREEAFSRYMETARRYEDRGDPRKALEQINLARRLKQTSELDDLEAKVKRSIAQAEQREAAERDRAYKGHVSDARQLFQKGKYEDALASVDKAKAIRSTAEVTKLEQDILRVSEGLRAERERVEQERRQKIEQEYDKYFKRAQFHLRNGDHDRALSSIASARKYKNTDDLNRLETQVRNAKRQGGGVASVTLIDIPPGLVNRYNDTIKLVELTNIPRGVKVLGQIGMTLNIRQNGQLAIQKVNDEVLRVIPARARQTIKVRILRKVASIFLPPPVDKRGNPVSVENWRLTFTVGTFMGKIILRRKF